jgi:phosphatidyl-myo-inositol dimannoside synthase
MRLLLVTQDFPPSIGGIQTYSKALADLFAERTEHFGVVAPLEPGCHDLDAQLPYPVHRLPLPRNLMRWTMLPFLSRICRQGNYRVALLAQWYSAAAANTLRRRGELDGVFAAAHGQELLRVPAQGSWLGRAYERHRKEVLSSVDGFFPVSEYTASLLGELGMPLERVHVVNNGTDIDRFRLSAQQQEALPNWREKHGLGEGPLLLTAARLVRRKGIDLVLRALSQVAQEFPKVHYAIVGSGPEHASLKELAAELGVADRVKFLGRLHEDDVAMAYNACDIFVMPARFEHPSVEGFGLVFREANSCGKPVVGSATGGIVDAIKHGYNGLLVEPNDVAEFAEAVLKLLREPDYAAALGKQGQELVETTGTWRHAAEQMLEIMQRLP